MLFAALKTCKLVSFPTSGGMLLRFPGSKESKSPLRSKVFVFSMFFKADPIVLKVESFCAIKFIVKMHNNVEMFFFMSVVVILQLTFSKQAQFAFETVSTEMFVAFAKTKKLVCRNFLQKLLPRPRKLGLLGVIGRCYCQ